jgi:hypothetical protein
MIWEKIDPAVLDIQMWLELLSRCDGDRFAEAPKIIRPKLSKFWVQFSTWATCLLKFGRSGTSCVCPPFFPNPNRSTKVL